MIQIYYGDGKGKTSCLNGSAIRAKGAGLNVIIFRFLKGIETSEDIKLKEPGIIVMKVHVGTKFVFQMKDDEKQLLKKHIAEVINFIKLNKDKYDMIILDELLDLVAKNVLMTTEEEILELVNTIKDKEVLISGHTKIKKLFNQADLITKFKKEKHYFDKGVQSRKGIEF